MTGDGPTQTGGAIFVCDVGVGRYAVGALWWRRGVPDGRFAGRSPHNEGEIMGSRITVRPTTSVGVIGLIAIISGVVMAVVGVGAWVVVSQQLGSERITVADDAPFIWGARR